MNTTRERLVAEPERYEFRALPIHQFELARREFFKILGAGIAVFAVAKDALAAQETAPGSPSFHSEELPKEIASWLHVGEDGTVTGFTGKAEMGQNIRTSISQTIADELRVPFASVRLVMADTTLTPFDAGTFGSRTTPTMTPQFRRVAEAARNLLIGVAAKEWNVAPEGLVAADAKVTDPVSKRSLTYAELARGKTLAQNLPAEDPITPSTEWKIAGKPLAKVDGRAFVTGSHKYTSDIRLEGMLYGKVLRPPSFGATLASCDDSAAKAMSSVVVVRDGDFVGVAAPSAQEAQKALDAIRTQWKEVPQVSSEEIFSYLKNSAEPSSSERFRREKGSLAEGLAAATHRLDATYNVAYIAHAPLEPRAAVAQFADGKLTVWTGTQRPFANRDELASVFHMSESNVRVIVPDTGAAYGGKHTSDAAIEAARLARAAGKPVKVVWTREDDLAGGWYRPMWHDRFVAGLDAAGNPVAWTHTIVGQSITEGTPFASYTINKEGVDSTSVEGAADILYGIPHLQVDLHSPKIGVPVQWWRSVGHSHTGFSVESFFDEVAHAGRKDPYELRRSLLANQPRMAAVLNLVAEKAGWGKPLPPGRGRGIATHFSFDSYVAQVIEASVEKDGTVRVHRVVCAVDCGRTVNPDIVKAQMEGGIIFGLTAALKTEITLENGRVQQKNFHDYQMLRMFESPEIEVYIVPSEQNPTGVGEPGVPPVASALTNAIFAATGKRVRRLPIRASDLVAGSEAKS